MKICEKCKKEHNGFFGSGRFCSRSCANTKIHSEETKRKISLSGKGHISPFKGVKNPNTQKYSKIHYSICVSCNNTFITSYSKGNLGRKTCSDRCLRLSYTNRTYLNGSRKTIYFFNEDQGVIVLESSWEEKIAELLCKKKIKWIRPEPIQWIDSKNKLHMYYPDFYLINYNVYLDPKNLYCMKKDKEKMEVISKNYKVVYGDISVVENYINLLVS